jgi:hypothetical protein
MLCLVPRDPTHLAACRRWPALCGVSAPCAMRQRHDAAVCLSQGAACYPLRNHCVRTVSKSRTSLLDNHARGDSDDVAAQTAVLSPE